MEEISEIDFDNMLDGNTAAGVLVELFGVEMTASATECDNCGREGELGTLLTFGQGHGIVLRCPACSRVMIRVVETPTHIILDARGAVSLRIARLPT
jgi:hypothetical protein